MTSFFENRARQFGQWLDDRRQLRKSRAIDVSGVKTACLFLGPYRNLTTLTASTLFLHPECQVLNHGGQRIYGRAQVDFLDGFTSDKLDRFLQYAIQLSKAGQRGDEGGSITHSHAFDRRRMRDVFQGSELPLVKDRIDSVVWKESLLTSNIVRERQLSLTALCDQEPRLRFLLPVRHPLDCAVSNVKTGHARRFPDLPEQPDVKDALGAILDEIFRFEALRLERPEAFMRFFEHELSRTTLVGLAEFLALEPRSGWLDAADEAVRLKPGYEHDAALIDHYRDAVEQRSTEYPELVRALLAFVEP